MRRHLGADGTRIACDAPLGSCNLSNFERPFRRKQKFLRRDPGRAIPNGQARTESRDEFCERRTMARSGWAFAIGQCPNVAIADRASDMAKLAQLTAWLIAGESPSN
jgi:hypothetical protein